MTCSARPLRSHTPRGGDLHQRQQRPARSARARIASRSGHRSASRLPSVAEGQRLRVDQRPGGGGQLGQVDAGQPPAELAARHPLPDRLQHRPQRQAVPGGDQVDGRALQRDPDRAPVGQRRAQLGRVEAVQPRPQPDVRVLRLLRLQADQVLDGVQRRSPDPAQQQLPVQQRPVERAVAEHGEISHAGHRRAGCGQIVAGSVSG